MIMILLTCFYIGICVLMNAHHGNMCCMILCLLLVCLDRKPINSPVIYIYIYIYIYI